MKKKLITLSMNKISSFWNSVNALLKVRKSICNLYPCRNISELYTQQLDKSQTVTKLLSNDHWLVFVFQMKSENYYQWKHSLLSYWQCDNIITNCWTSWFLSWKDNINPFSISKFSIHWYWMKMIMPEILRFF